MDTANKAYTLCGAKTRSGTPCAKYPINGKRRCRLHGGLSTGPRTAEGRARIASAQLKHGRYVNWREKRAKEKYYLSEIERLLHEAKRAGFLPDWSTTISPDLLTMLKLTSQSFTTSIRIDLWWKTAVGVPKTTKTQKPKNLTPSAPMEQI